MNLAVWGEAGFKGRCVDHRCTAGCTLEVELSWWNCEGGTGGVLGSVGC